MNDYNECESCRRRYYYARVMSHSGETYHEHGVYGNVDILLNKQRSRSREATKKAMKIFWKRTVIRLRTPLWYSLFLYLIYKWL